MKKGFILAGAIAVLLAGAVFALATVDFNRAGKDHAYYHITADYSVEETKLDSGEVMKRYVYSGPAFKENGETFEVEFTAAKQLREDAYLKLYVNKGKTVTSYDEVQKSDIPEQVKI